MKTYRIRPLSGWQKSTTAEEWHCRHFRVERDNEGMFWPCWAGHALRMFDAEGDEYVCFSTLDAAIECCESAQANLLYSELEEFTPAVASGS